MLRDNFIFILSRFIIKKLISSILAAAVLLTTGISAQAAESVGDTDRGIGNIDVNSEVLASDIIDEDYVLVSENEFIDDDGWFVKTEVFTKDDDICLYAADSGSKTYRCQSTWWIKSGTKDVKWITMWIEGEFTWDRAKDIAEVETDESRCGYEVHLGKCEDQGHTFSYGTAGRTFLFGKKYAYIERTAKIWNCVEHVNAKNFRIWLDVDVTGATHPTPGDSLQK